ncbi:hypothetical protein [Altericista sp. CCNU0014]|uniref:hypothetical protein n=1 Tax=Altericista sp. CCNU0014 TaxID=3082949 RepID=UPI0038510DC6
MFSDNHQIDSSGPKARSWLQKAWVLLTGDDPSKTASPYASQRALHATTQKLVQVHRQVERLQAQHNLEMIRLAQAYHEISPEERAALPKNLRQQLDLVESSYYL